jgi:ABC-2 type transport system permease protein
VVTSSAGAGKTYKPMVVKAKNVPLINHIYTNALALTRQVNGRQQRIIVAGDADFMSNAQLSSRSMKTANFLFNTALFSWLDNGLFPIDTSRPDAKDTRVTVSTDYVGLLKIIYIWILPSLLLIFGTVLLIRRKRK